MLFERGEFIATKDHKYYLKNNKSIESVLRRACLLNFNHKMRAIRIDDLGVPSNYVLAATLS
jgi:hypothetical protein